MKILILTTFFSPDTAISAVRPYMFAKHLCRMGHDVTVIRSGERNKCFDNSLPVKGTGMKVISYFGNDSPAERFESGRNFSQKKVKSRAWFLPYSIRIKIAAIIHRLERPLDCRKLMKNAERRVELQKRVIDTLAGEKFDIVFATVGNFENITAAEYASRKLNCPWIVDFRDPLVKSTGQSRAFSSEMRKLEETAVRKADAVISVSEDLSAVLEKRGNGQRLFTIYNGYEEIQPRPVGTLRTGDSLVFCYTGRLYKNQDCSPLFAALSALANEGRICLDKVSFVYAGDSFKELYRQAHKHGVESILENKGYVDRQTAVTIQLQSDIYIVLSWNTPEERGILTGKFYEGIRAGRPILSIINGLVADSELYRLNEKYHYGFCAEKSREDSGGQLREWILEAYNRKMKNLPVEYSPRDGMFDAFRYDGLTKQLESLFSRIIEQQDEN